MDYKLSSPYSDCVKDASNVDSFDSVYYKAIFRELNMSLYRQKNCLPLCLQDYLKENCKCLDGSNPVIYKDIPICSSLDKLDCVQIKRSEYFADENLSKKCYKECPLECDSSNILNIKLIKFDFKKTI